MEGSYAVRLVCLGDLLLDVIVRLEEPLARGLRADATAVTQLGPGGQAANVAAWAASLGAEARFVGKRGGDDAGRLAAAGLAARGVDVVGPVAEGRNGVVVSLVSPDGDRTMASDRGVAPDLRADELDEQWFDGCNHLHLSGYSLLRSPIDGAALRATGLAPRVSVDLSSWSVIESFGAERFRARLEGVAPAIVFANEDEERLLGGPLTGATWVLKRGARGVVVDGVEHKAASVRAVLDTTGAGDALAAGFIVGGVEVGLAAAARCVAQLGAMPPAVERS
jgi:sugar/nucleoside kinase (ribokinase family)